MRNFLMSLGRGMFPPDYVMMETASGFWVAKAIGVAVDLELADLLKEGPLSVQVLAEKTGTHAASLLRLMRVLSGNGIFRNMGNGVFANNKMSQALMEERNSMKYFFRHHLGDNNWDFIGDLENCVRTGQNAIIRKTGQEPFEYLRDHPEKNRVFNRAMTDSNEMSLPLFLLAFPFGKYRKIIDVGGGQGYMVSGIAFRNPSVECTVFDQPHVVPLAKENFRKFGVGDRCHFIEGNFFEKVPEGGELYLLKNILHDWDDADCLRILKNLHAAMPATARLLIIESLITDDNKNSFGKILDLQMLAGTSGGRERTREEYAGLLSAAGLKLLRTIDTATPFHFIVASKA